MKLNLKAKKILLIEDHAIVREAIKHMLFDLEARKIYDLATGDGAIAMMKDTAFDIVICDYHLGPGKNGQQLLEEARFSKLLPPHAVFILVTVEQQQSVVLSAMDNRPDDYLTKPFNAQQLLSRLYRSFQRKQYFANIDREIFNGNLFLAVQHCQQLLEHGDKQMRMQLLKIRAELAIQTGDVETAQQLYHGVLKERDLAWGRLGLGVVAFELGNYELAIGYFKQLLELYPAMLDAYDWLAKSHEALEQRGLALEAIETAVAYSPQAILRQQKLAQLASDAGQLEVAQKAYKSAIKLGKNSVHKSSKDLSGLAHIYLKTNATVQAQQLVTELKCRFSDEPEAELQAALLSIEVNKKSGLPMLARQAYEMAVQLSEQMGRTASKETRLQVAKTCLLHQDIDFAKTILTDLVKSNIDNKAYINSIKQLCSNTGQDSFADALINETKQDLIDINNKGVYLFKQGKLKEALETLENAAETLPDNKTILLNLAKIAVHDLKRASNNPNKLLKAKAYIDKAVELGMTHDKIGKLRSEITLISQQQLDITLK